MWAGKVFRRYLISQSGIYQNELISRILIKTQNGMIRNISELHVTSFHLRIKIAFVSDLYVTRI